ncbi:MAG: SGNH/GDSL hydrolase family protein [Solidesulfovibrio sp.]
MIHLLFVVLALIAANALVLRSLSRLKKSRARTSGMALLSVVDSVMVVLIVLELGMALFFAQSDGFNLTMSSRNWFERHWHPINSLGYRDVEPQPISDHEKFVLLLGDSFTAGHGINSAEDRFGNVLARDLGPGWRVGNAAKNGWDTGDEARALQAYPVTPDVVVLAYYVNDIFRAAKECNFSMPFAVHFPKNFVSKYLVNHFALVNFVYWRLARMGNMQGAVQGFSERLQAAYDDPQVWAAHVAELDAIVGWCRERHIRLIAMVIPNLGDVAGSTPITARVVSYFTARGVQSVDLAPRLSGRAPADMMVNGVDSHANVRLNAEMAELLCPVILSRPDAH